MFSRILKRMREKVRRGVYVMTTHAEEEADEDNLGIFDVESTVLTGSIVERQKDRETDEWKYVVQGESLDGRVVFVVARFGALGNLYFLTAYAEEREN